MEKCGMRATTEFLTLSLALLVAIRVSADGGVCECLQDPPRKNAQPMVFCNWYKSRSCCLPAHDADINGKFSALIEAGPACEKYQNVAKRFLSIAFCYACDPDQPLYLSTPLDTRFFSARIKSVKICWSVAKNMAPTLFSDCGLTLPDDRDATCSPNSPVVPQKVWPDCQNQQYICVDATTKAWYCSDTMCGADNTPSGFNDAPCNSTRHTCDGVLMFLNDNRAAKPPNFEDYPVEIIDEQLCRKEYGKEETATICKCLHDPSTARQPNSPLVIVVLAFIILFALDCAPVIG